MNPNVNPNNRRALIPGKIAYLLVLNGMTEGMYSEELREARKYAAGDLLTEIDRLLHEAETYGY